MPTDADQRLRTLLGGEPPPGLSALAEPARAAFTDLVVDARRRQAAALQSALTDTLQHVPFPVRGVVRKVLLG